MKLVLKSTKPKTNGHSDVMSLGVNNEVAERCLKRAQQRAWTAPEDKRAQQSRTPLEDGFQPTAEDLGAEQQPGHVVLAKIEQEQKEVTPHTCGEEPNPLYKCPGLKATRQKLVNLAHWRGYTSAADDIAQNCFEAALKAQTTVNCVCRFAAHGRAFRWATAREDREETTRERWAKGSMERQGLVMMWVKDGEDDAEGHWDGYVPQDTGLEGAALDRYLDLMAVVEASPRQHTKLAVEQVMTGCKAMKAAGLPTLSYNRVSEEMARLKKEYEQLKQLGRLQWQAEQLFYKTVA